MEKNKDAVARLGCLLKNIPYEHGKEYEYLFNITHNTFFQKMVPLNIVECGFNMESEKYLGLMIFLDYLVNVLFGEDKVLNNLRTLYERMQENRGKNYEISSDLVILESAITTKEIALAYKNRTGKDYFKECAPDIKKRFDQQDYALDFDSESIRQTDPYYNAIGLMIYDLLSDENKGEVLHLNSREDLKALLFTDYAMKYLKDEGITREVKENIKKHDYFTASLLSLDGLGRAATTSLEEFKKKPGE